VRGRLALVCRGSPLGPAKLALEGVQVEQSLLGA
jgi:hypothetical protein